MSIKVHRKKSLLTLPLAWGLLALSCAVFAPSQPPGIGEVVTAKAVDVDYKPLQPTTTFNSMEPVYTSVEVNNLAVGTTIVAKFRFGDQLEETSLTADKAGSGYYSFSLIPEEGGLPPGDYTVEIYLDGELIKTASFTVVPNDPPSIGEIVTAKGVDANYEPLDPTNTFSTTDTIFTSVEVKDLVVGTTVTAKYRFGDHLQEISLVAEESGSGYYSFSLSPGTSGHPAGDYTVEIYLDGELAGAASFAVVK